MIFEKKIRLAFSDKAIKPKIKPISIIILARFLALVTTMVTKVDHGN